MEAVRDRLMYAMRATPTAGGGTQPLAACLAAVLKCLRDDSPASRAAWFQVLLAADIACDERMRRAVLPPVVGVLGAVEAAFLAELELDFPSAPEHELRKAAAFKALMMTDMELLLLVTTDIEF